MQISARNLRLQKSPDDGGNVLAGRNLPGEFGNFIIQKPVIHAVGDFALQNFFQFLEVKHHARGRIGLARYSYFQHVIVTVTMRIIALPKDAPILLRRESRIMVEMRRGELDFARNVNH